MQPEEKARVKIDHQLREAGWNVVARDKYLPGMTLAVREALMRGTKESDYVLFIDDKAIAVVEAKRAENPLGPNVAQQAEDYAQHPAKWYGLWLPNRIPLVYLANGEQLLFKDLRHPAQDYVPLAAMHTPKDMLYILGKTSTYGALPYLESSGLRDCQYQAELALEQSMKQGGKRYLAVLATGAGKTYLACLAAYRLLTYTPTRRILFLADRNNLTRQAESEFQLFDRTEHHRPLSELYSIGRLQHPDALQNEIVIATIQKLYAVLTGASLASVSEDEEDERLEQEAAAYTDSESAVVLPDDVRLPPDYFQFIIIDECHRSIYGKWRSVLDYFREAHVLGLTATPTPEAETFFDENVIERYTSEEAVVDGVSVPPRVFSIWTDITAHGGMISRDSHLRETVKRTGKVGVNDVAQDVVYEARDVDLTILNDDQIHTVLACYRDNIYTELYPERREDWASIPKTLIFAKDDCHATRIVEIAKDVFGEKFPGGRVPDAFVQKITYAAGDSNELIRQLRRDKAFRIAVTVTLVATGTDVKPLEVVLFMKDVRSQVLYTQMKGRGCRVLSPDELREVTPNARTKDCYYIVDAVGVTESEKHVPRVGMGGTHKRNLTLEELLEHLAHNELSDDNLARLRDTCAAIHRRYENNPLFEKHLAAFMKAFSFSPRDLANRIQHAFDQANILEPYTGPSETYPARRTLVAPLIESLPARQHLLDLQRGYDVTATDKDRVLYAGFSVESARSLIDAFEAYLQQEKDHIEALHHLSRADDTALTRRMLVDLQTQLLRANRAYTQAILWQNYQRLDADGSVDPLHGAEDTVALTTYIPIVRYAYHKMPKLTSLRTGYEQRFQLYRGQAQRVLNDDQAILMKRIADIIIGWGAITPLELNTLDPDLWRQAISTVGAPALADEMQTLSLFILRTA